MLINPSENHRLRIELTLTQDCAPALTSKFRMASRKLIRMRLAE